MTHNRRMLPINELAALLRAVNVDAVSQASGVSAKTIYRIRRIGDGSVRPPKDTYRGPTARVAEVLCAAARAVKRATPRKRTSAAGK